MRKKAYWLGLAMIMVAVALVVVVPKSAPAAEAPFVEDGVLKKSRIDNSGVETVIATDVDRVISITSDTTEVLYSLKKEVGRPGGEVWLINLETGTKSKIFDNAIEARMSGDGKSFVVWREDHVILYRAGRVGEWKQIGGYGAAPIISHNGKYILYEKLADQSPDGDIQGLFEFAKGIALYDIRTGEEQLLTNTEHGEDFAPIGISVDGKTVYFNSTRAAEEGPDAVHNAAIWAVDIEGKNIRQLTNKNSLGDLVPTISSGALWTSDRQTAISSYFGEGAVWRFTFSPDGKVDAKKIAEGEQPQWTINDKQFVVRAKENGKTKWKKFDIAQ